jgi:DNA-binding SARP family transcriptional activator
MVTPVLEDPRPLHGAHVTPTRLRLTLLNRFQLSRDDEAIALPNGAQRLLAFLAVRGRRVQRLSVACTLWIDVSEQRATANLRSAVWRLKEVADGLVDADQSELGLTRDVQVDLHRLKAESGRVLDDETGGTSLTADIAALTGDLLPDWYDDWVLVERERVRHLRLHALETLCDELSLRDHYAAAVRAGLAAVMVEPLRESAHRVLIAAHLRAGNQHEALREYEGYRRLLLSEIGLPPSPRIDALVAPLRPR